MSWSRKLNCAAAAASLAVAGGCVALNPLRPERPPEGRSREEAEQAAATYRDPVARSALREDAFGLLQNEAASEHPAIRANAIEALARFHGRAEPLVAAALKDPNEGVRTVAAMVVGRQKLNALSASVRPLLDDASPYVRSAAIFALVRNGESVDQTPLATLLLTHSDPRVRAHAAFLLGEIGNPSALPLLKEAATVRIPRVGEGQRRIFRLQIAEAMVKLGDDEQLQPIRAALFPSTPEELEAAALAVQIIGQVQDVASDDQLIYLTGFVDPQGNPMPAEIRLAAAGSLAQLGSYDGSFIADSYVSSEVPAIRAQAAFVYGQAGPVENLAVLKRLMADPEPVVRVAAADAVLEILEPSTR